LTKAEYKVRGGKLIKVQLTARGNAIEKVKITGDFFLHPEELIEEMEKMLEGHLLDERDLAELIKVFIEKSGATLLGASPEDFARCITMAGEKSD
jgi:hypothetical protein